VLIASYDVLRNDFEFLGGLRFNYCVLDEGHLIKNSKSRTAIAVKSLNAASRLVLSGTPIQNNVLELWSLFDFLMPGFLGTESEFNGKYGKPISAARNASMKAAAERTANESGILAMEALHRFLPHNHVQFSSDRSNHFSCVGSNLMCCKICRQRLFKTTT